MTAIVKMEAVEKKVTEGGMEEAQKMEEDEEMEVDFEDIPEGYLSFSLCGFMELVFHHLMYVKNVYPRDAFEKTVRQNVPVWVCVHPAVVDYVNSFLNFAHKVLKQTMKLKVLFTLCRRNKEVLEEFYFDLIVKEPFVESQSKLVCMAGKLASICEDITKTNTFSGYNTMQSGLKEITFEMQLLLDPSVELPEQSPEYRWVVNYNPQAEETENPVKMVTPLKDEHNKTYKVRVYACKKE